jgi:pyruvate formate lyase activating enzyme
MKIGGLQKVSFIDYPGKMAAIIFTMGCNFRCPYCHNPELVDETGTLLDIDAVCTFLEHRKNILDAVTITGGEPTLQSDLFPFIQKIKDMGYLVKLDTNGTHPEVIEALMSEHLVDYIAMDIKGPLREYEKTTARPVDTNAIRRSIALLMEGTIPYEFRTTVVKSLLTPEDLNEIGGDIQGARLYYLQKFVPNKTLNPAFLRKTTYTDDEFETMRRMMETYVTTCALR